MPDSVIFISLNSFFFIFILIREDAKKPCFWSQVCVHNMARLAKEATTTRHVLEPLFHYFDNGNLWSMEDGLAFPVLKDIQVEMESSNTEGTYSSSLVTLRFDLLWKE